VRVLIDVERRIQGRDATAARQKHYSSDSGPSFHAHDYLALGTTMSPISGVEYP
jgi:hypothetical protein